MNATCPACGTENRAFAKFCIECIGTLPTSFAPTEFSPRLGAARKEPVAGPASHAARIATAPQPPAAPVLAPPPPAESPVLSKKGLWVSVAAFAIALLVGAAGWLVAGAGGWYIYTSSTSSPTAPVVPVVPAQMPPAPAASHAEANAPPPLAPLITPPAGFPPPEAVEPAPSSPSSPAATLSPAPRSKAATSHPASEAASPAVRLVNPPSTPRVAKERSITTASPAAQCAGRGFIAESRCMAERCAIPPHRQHPACDAVRRQLRMMEEKRNPTMAN